MKRIGLRILLFIALAQVVGGVWAGNQLYTRQFEWPAATAKVQQQFPCTRDAKQGTCVAVHFDLPEAAGERRATTVIARIRRAKTLAQMSAGGEFLLRYDPKRPLAWEPVTAQAPWRWIVWGVFVAYALAMLGITLRALREARKNSAA